MIRFALVVAASACAFQGAAQSYPSRPVRIVVPLSPGGFADVEATVMAPEPLAEFTRAEHEKWGRVVRETGATVN